MRAAFAACLVAALCPAAPAMTAPASRRDVVVHVAANASNDDASEFGDNLYAAAFRVEAAGPDGSGVGSAGPGRR